MKNTKAIFASVLIAIAAISLISCGSSEGFADGVYFAMEDGFADSGWRYNVTFVVEDGAITEASWNGANIEAGVDKVTLSENGGYPMVANGGAQAEWHVQAQAVESYLVEEQSAEMPDAISGASIHFTEFFALVNEALEEGPVGYGPYADGTYHAEQAEFHNGYRYFVDVTVTSGYIVAANWDAYAEDGGKMKAQASADGEYGMYENAGSIAPWFEQARAVEAAFIEAQSTDQPDAVSGATIGLEEFYALAAEALAGASR